MCLSFSLNLYDLKDYFLNKFDGNEESKDEQIVTFFKLLLLAPIFMIYIIIISPFKIIKELLIKSSWIYLDVIFQVLDTYSDLN